jgi:uncharacterized LabA/DUF88 family protein
MPTVHAYIDGFNFYYGCVKGTPYKWLDLSKLCHLLLPKGFQLSRIRYFTARVAGLPGNPDAPTRQNIYLRALATLPSVEVVFGHFLGHKVMMPLADPPAVGPRFVRVLKTEEKGSDVNLASQLLLDAFTRACDAALIISNDSDLLSPIRIARDRFGLRIILANPHKKHSAVLIREADYVRQIRQGALKASQFPDTLTDAVGSFHKPDRW